MVDTDNAAAAFCTKSSSLNDSATLTSPATRPLSPGRVALLRSLAVLRAIESGTLASTPLMRVPMLHADHDDGNEPPRPNDPSLGAGGGIGGLNGRPPMPVIIVTDIVLPVYANDANVGVSDNRTAMFYPNATTGLAAALQLASACTSWLSSPCRLIV